MRMKKRFKAFLEAYYAIPESFAAILLVGCEIFCLLAISAIVLQCFSANYELSDTLGSVAVKSLVISVIVAAASGIVCRVYPRKDG